jgi:hypothetical protein
VSVVDELVDALDQRVRQPLRRPADCAPVEVRPPCASACAVARLTPLAALGPAGARSRRRGGSGARPRRASAQLGGRSRRRPRAARR